MLKRIITGVLLAAGSIVVIIWGIVPLTLLALIIAILGTNEYIELAYRQKIRPSKTMSFFGVVLLIFSAYIGTEEFIPFVLIGITLITMLFYIYRKGFHISPFHDVGAAVFGVIYIGLFFSYLIFLRKLSIPGTSGFFNLLGYNIEQGAGFVLLLIFSTSFTDIAAFFVGKFLGRRKLCPSISPGKTVEGSIGGILGAVGGAFLIGSQLSLSVSDIVYVGITCGIFAQLGDLWESLLKRNVNVKDSGDIVTGHGGVLDRFDSLLFTAPLIYYYIKYFMF